MADYSGHARKQAAKRHAHQEAQGDELPPRIYESLGNQQDGATLSAAIMMTP